MAPSRSNQATSPYAKDEKVLCFHHEMLYEAKILDVRPTEAGKENTNWQYKIHYKGWKNTWDDWVPQDRVRKFTDENKELAAQLHNQMKMLQNKAPKSITKGKTGRANGSDFSSARGSEERHASAAAQSSRGPRRHRDYDLENEESFHARPSVHLPIPDHIKAILVDDWENVTKNQQLVPVPSDHSVDSILNDYLAFENPKRQAGSHQADLLLEVVAGLKEYFEKCLGRILLYRFERQQYLEVREEWATSGKSALTTYGAEHFCRLLVSLPELLAQTNMDQQSCNRLCEELTKLTIWLGRNAKLYFAKEYETPGPSYIEKARAG
ncbi:histone acetylase complex subunit [Acephala macrosclerotiorum]|nr:histone acetylase complex subunit [Acephala macrosclerotiorum]